MLVNPPPAVLTFDFNAVHPGSNLFGTVGDVNNALIVIAEHPVIDPVTGLFSTSPNGVIKTSQGGGPTTIGVNSQMFDPGEGAYFTYVKNPDPNFLAGAPNGLSPTEANDADNILYSGGTNTATSASTFIVQTQGNSPATMAITAFDIADSPQARDFVSGLGSGTQVNITSVTDHCMRTGRPRAKPRAARTPPITSASRAVLRPSAGSAPAIRSRGRRARLMTEC